MNAVEKCLCDWVQKGGAWHKPKDNPHCPLHGSAVKREDAANYDDYDATMDFNAYLQAIRTIVETDSLSAVDHLRPFVAKHDAQLLIKAMGELVEGRRTPGRINLSDEVARALEHRRKGVDQSH